MPGLISTRSPGRARVTPAPTASTNPAPSAPMMCGNRESAPGSPCATNRSRWFSAAAWTAIRTCPGPGGPGSGTCVTVTWARPPVAVRTQARIAPGLRQRQERRGDHLLGAEGGDRYRGARADGLHVHAIRGVAAVLRLGVDHQGEQVAGRRDGERNQRQVRAREGGDLARRQIRFHYLLDGAAALLPLDEIRQGAVLQEPRLALPPLRAPRELPLVGPVAVHQPDVVILVAQRDVGDGAPVGRHRGRQAHGVLRELLYPRPIRIHREDLELPPGALGLEQDRLAVGREDRMPVELGIAGETRDVAAVRVHGVDLGVAVAVRDERDARAVWRERRVDLLAGV